MQRPEESTTKTVDQVDLEKPVYVVFYQTPAKNLFSHHPDKESARTFAQGRAEVGNKVAVFGPQIALFVPPEKPIVREKKLDFKTQV